LDAEQFRKKWQSLRNFSDLENKEALPVSVRRDERF
jgi:hypothetical protein